MATVADVQHLRDVGHPETYKLEPTLTTLPELVLEKEIENLRKIEYIKFF